MNMDYCLSELKALLSIDSPSGFTDKAADYLIGELTALGYAPERTRKGGVFCCLGGEGSPLVLMAHVDTLGGMISTIKPNGRITITPIGGLRAVVVTDVLQFLILFAAVITFYSDLPYLPWWADGMGVALMVAIPAAIVGSGKESRPVPTLLNAVLVGFLISVAERYLA